MNRERVTASMLMLWGLGGGAGAQAAASQGGDCASTPAAALLAARAGANAAALMPGSGYRVESVRWDAAQRQSWAVIRSCDHAERPAMTMPTDLPPRTGLAAVVAPGSAVTAANFSASTAQANMAQPVVRAGDQVRLWRTDGPARIELTGTAEENGVAGARVRVRLTKPKDADGQQAPAQFLAGVVRGPADVEMQP